MGGAFTPLSMQRSWLNDVSPPSSIGTSMDFQNNDTMLNSLITSSDFANVNFLLNGSVVENNIEQTRRVINNNTYNRETIATPTAVNNPNNISQNLMNFTFDVNKTITNGQPNATFGIEKTRIINNNNNNHTFVTAAVTDSEPIKEVGIENTDIQLNSSTEDVGKNLTFNKYDCNLTWDELHGIQNLNNTIIQSTPVHNPDNDYNKMLRNIKDFDDTISPISSLNAQNCVDQNNFNALDDDEDDEILLRNIKGKCILRKINFKY